MSDFGHVVSWYNADEWQKVYLELCDATACKESVLNNLLVWKARCPSLPSGIESTLTLLQVHVEDTKQNKDEANDQLIRLAYSSAIMRFVNHMLDTETVKGSSLYKAAKNLGVPDWVIDLRHDAAHSNNLPQITLLREACAISLQWLQINYWDKYKPNIQNYLSSQRDKSEGDANKIGVLINLISSLSICGHTNCKIKNLSEIPNVGMRESIVNDVQDLFGDLVNLSNLQTVSLKSLINIVTKHSNTILDVPDVSEHINEALLGNDSFFMSKELLYFFCAYDLKRQNRLNNSYIQCFEVLLTFLHSNKLLLDFILALVAITQNIKAHEHFKARLAALWLSEILLALKRSQEFSIKLRKALKENKKLKKKDLKHLYHHWFPSTKGNNLLLDLQKPVPEQLLDINYIQPIIAAYNPYLVYFIRNLLNLINPTLPNAVAARVCRLAEVISAPEKFPLSTSTVYTADDIKLNSGDSDDDVQMIIEPIDVEVPLQRQDKEVSGIWRLSSQKCVWSSYPLGQLPQWENISIP